MKKFIIILLSIFSFTQIASAQLVVSDPKVAALLYKQSKTSLSSLAKAGESIKIAQERLDVIKDAQESLSKVNSAISQGKMVAKVGSNFTDIGKTLLQIPSRISRLEYDFHKTSFGRKFVDITDELDILTELVSNSLQDNLLEASDTERMKFLYELFRSSATLKTKARSLSAKIYSKPMNIQIKN